MILIQSSTNPIKQGTYTYTEHTATICGPSCFCRNFVQLHVFLPCGDTHVSVFLFSSRGCRSTFVRQYTCIGHFRLFNTCCRWIIAYYFCWGLRTCYCTCIGFLCFQYIWYTYRFPSFSIHVFGVMYCHCVSSIHMYRSCGWVLNSHSRNFYVGTMDDWVKCWSVFRCGGGTCGVVVCGAILFPQRFCHAYFLNVSTYCTHVFALALCSQHLSISPSKNNESAPLNNKWPLEKQTSESDQRNVHSGQTQTFISKMPNGLSRFPVDFSMACWTAAKGKLSPRSIHKNVDPPPRSPPPYWGFQVLGCRKGRFKRCGLSKSEDWGKRPFFLRFWTSQVLFRPFWKRATRQKNDFQEGRPDTP